MSRGYQLSGLALCNKAVFLQAVRRLRGTLLFRGLRPSSSWGFPCWLLGLTVQSSRPAFGGRLTLFVSLRKTCIIQPHALFTGIYLLKRLSAGFLPCAGLRLWAVRQFQVFFASIASPPWRTVFSRFALVVNLGLPVLASGSNRAVKPTCLRQAAYFRSLAFHKSPKRRSNGSIQKWQSVNAITRCRVRRTAFTRHRRSASWHLSMHIVRRRNCHCGRSHSAATKP